MPARAADLSPAPVEPGSDLDPEIRAFVAGTAEDLAAYPPLEELPVAEARRILESARARWARGGPVMAETTELDVSARSGPVRLRIHRPSTSGLRPALVYLHGGGWTYFSLDTHDRLMREYAARADVVVIGVDYALAPEHKFPVALDQVADVLRGLAIVGRTLGVDPGRLAVGGDSAGANLAIAACLVLRDSGGPAAIRAMVLNYGAFDSPRGAALSHRFGRPGYMLGNEEMQRYWMNYVRSEADLQLPLVCPLRAELAGLPPALLVIPECDLLAEQGRAMADKLRAARVPVRAHAYSGASHSFLEAMSVAAVSRRALDDTAVWLREQLHDRSVA
jgi:acetyl esterase